MSPAPSIGWYNFVHKGGEFLVCLRPAGAFFCPQFRAGAFWHYLEEEGGVLKIEWANYGKYAMKLGEDGITWEGSVINKPESWRKMTFARPLSDAELLLLNTEWNFQYEKGEFPVEFRGDGFNHFVCKSHSAHAHWDFNDDENKLLIDWAQYGKYEMTIDVAAKTMTGNKLGQPANWRKANLIRSLSGDEASTGLISHDHSHDH